MTVVIPFAARRRAVRRDKPEGGAAILFFTGVRYEREPETVEREQPGPRPRPRRAGGRTKIKRLAALSGPGA